MQPCLFQSGKLPFSDITNDSIATDTPRKSHVQSQVFTKPELDHIDQVSITDCLKLSITVFHQIVTHACILMTYLSSCVRLLSFAEHKITLSETEHLFS